MTTWAQDATHPGVRAWATSELVSRELSILWFCPCIGRDTEHTMKPLTAEAAARYGYSPGASAAWTCERCGAPLYAAE